MKYSVLILAVLLHVGLYCSAVVDVSSMMQALSSQHQELQAPDPLVAVLIMVKNEATVMRETLEPLLKAGLKSYLILDTGSTDNTIEVVYQTFADYGIVDGHVIEQPFVDFATSRNYLIDRAEEIFPQAGFFFMIDAEWYVQNAELILPLCAEYYKTPFHVFVATISCGGDEEITANRLFRARQGARFVGAVHEYIGLESVNISTPIYINYRPRTAGLQKSVTRLHRDLELLFAEHEKNPTIVRHAFFIGQTYHCMQDLEKAAEWYKKASEMQGWDELLFIAKHRAAQCYEALDNWPLALVTFLKAFSMRPTRAEPLVSIAIHYWNNSDPLVAFMFAKQAFAIEYPALDCCYINKAIYQETRYDVLARAAWCMGQYETGMQAIAQGLQHNPTSQQFNNLLELYKTKLMPS